jgi:hypothetical protein
LDSAISAGMSDIEIKSHKSVIALLSASNEMAIVASGASATTLILGQPLISRQIAVLREAGIAHFVIAIDNLPGVLLALADQLADLGVKVEFVRSAQELSEKLVDADFLFVQAECVMADRQLIDECLAVRSPYIATMDGREENRGFENIDLNTVWAGLALLPTAITQKMIDLPEDWSVSSSLLRQAVTQKIHRRSIPQNIAQSGALQIIQSDQDVKALEASLISNYDSGFDGWIESKLFTPVAKRLFPFVQRSISLQKLVNLMPGLVALSALVSASAGYKVIASSLSILVLLLISIRRISKISNPFLVPTDLIEMASFGLLATAAAAMVARTEVDDPRFGIVALVVAGLIAVSAKMPLGNAAAQLLRSPALFAVSLLLAGGIVGPVSTVLAFSVVQVVILLIGIRK